MTTMKLLAGAASLTAILIGSATAQTVEKQSDGTVIWQAGINGVTLEFNPDGSVKRIFSKYSHPVSIPDKRGVHTAMIIAEEKAKGEIVRFLQQEVESGRAVKEFEDTASKSTQEKTAAGETLTSVDQRTISQSLTELTSSYSKGKLSGVVVLENGYDEKEWEGWVVVGLSEKTMAASKAAQERLDDAQRPGSGTVTTGPAAERPKSVIRRGNQDF
jgi:hypothetical protein